ncbi:MAG: Stp1/IreP family PP2C-type Ser/Thr phosphatase [Blastocatellia bacterium]
MGLPVTITHRTDPGRERHENQDSIGHIRDERTGLDLLIIADGVGGGACGQVASRLAVQTIRQTFFALMDEVIETGERLRQAVLEANRMILQRARGDRSCKGMGSTCAVLVVIEDVAYLAHVGDSRIYLIRQNRIVRLTRDHTRVQRMLEDGLITEEEAASHPERNWLDRALGLREELRVEVRGEPLVLEPEDLLVVCTDGLTGLVRDDEIFRILRQMPAEEATGALIATANARGGPDNISIAIARIGAEPLSPPPTRQ